MSQFDELHAINGTFGEVYLEGEFVSEATALKAEIKMDYMDVPMCGDLSKHQKPSGRTGTGSLTLTKVNTRMGQLLSGQIKAGKTPRFTIISALNDPDAIGAERVVLKYCQFDSLILVNWSAKTLGTETYPFTFTDWEYLDMIDA